MTDSATSTSTPSKAKVSVILDADDYALFTAVAVRDRASLSTTIRRLAVKGLGEVERREAAE